MRDREREREQAQFNKMNFMACDATLAPNL